MLLDNRTGKNTRHDLSGSCASRCMPRLAGYEDVNDQENLTRDPNDEGVVGKKKALERPAASQNTVSRFEPRRSPRMRTSLRCPSSTASGQRSDGSHEHKEGHPGHDSSESPVHGSKRARPGTAISNSGAYHPFSSSNQEGDCEARPLRPGNVPLCEGMEGALEPVGWTGTPNSGRKLYFRETPLRLPRHSMTPGGERHLYAIRLKGKQQSLCRD